MAENGRPRRVAAHRVRIQDGVDGTGADDVDASASSHQQNEEGRIPSNPVRTSTPVEELNSGEADVSRALEGAVEYGQEQMSRWGDHSTLAQDLAEKLGLRPGHATAMITEMLDAQAARYQGALTMNRQTDFVKLRVYPLTTAMHEDTVQRELWLTTVKLTLGAESTKALKDPDHPHSAAVGAYLWKCCSQGKHRELVLCSFKDSGYNMYVELFKHRPKDAKALIDAIRYLNEPRCGDRTIEEWHTTIRENMTVMTGLTEKAPELLRPTHMATRRISEAAIAENIKTPNGSDQEPILPPFANTPFVIQELQGLETVAEIFRKLSEFESIATPAAGVVAAIEATKPSNDHCYFYYENGWCRFGDRC